MNCKICGHTANEIFSLPISKYAGGPILDKGETTPYYKCLKCDFLFSDFHAVYDTDYWGKLDPKWDGRALETMRLYLWASNGKQKSVLDWGCGKGGFVRYSRLIGIEAYGTDINLPAKENFFEIQNAPKTDIVTACEVVEHFENPVECFKNAVSHANEFFVFQTAYYDPSSCKRDWWYLGPHNGHVSLYSKKSLDVLADILGIKKQETWRGYAGIQCWKV